MRIACRKREREGEVIRAKRTEGTELRLVKRRGSGRKRRERERSRTEIEIWLREEGWIEQLGSR